MPPGGHLDDNETPEECAKRECKEETNLDVEIIGDRHSDLDIEIHLFQKNPSEGQMLKKPIAMLLEEIPACPERGEPAHQHMDFLYRARPIDEMQVVVLEESEGRELRWFTRDEIEKLDEAKEIFSNVKEYILEALE